MSLLLALSAGTNYALACNAGVYTYTGQAATLVKASGPVAYVLTCAVGSYTYTGQVATLTYTSGATTTKSGVNRLWLIEYYTKEHAKKTAKTLSLPTSAKSIARRAAQDALVEAQVTRAERDIEVLTQGIKDAEAAQKFTYNLILHAKSSPVVEVDFMRIATRYRERIARDDDELLLLSMVL